MTQRAGSLALALLLSMVATAPVSANELTSIGIGGPDGWPRSSLTLEVGTSAATLRAHRGGGGTTVELDAPTVIRVRRLSDCETLVRFVAEPGRSYWIRFEANGTAHVADRTQEGMDAGPGLGLHRAVCPALPDTSTVSTVVSTIDLRLLLILVAVTATVIAYLRRSRSHHAGA